MCDTEACVEIGVGSVSSSLGTECWKSICYTIGLMILLLELPIQISIGFRGKHEKPINPATKSKYEIKGTAEDNLDTPNNDNGKLFAGGVDGLDLFKIDSKKFDRGEVAAVD
jgi:hypothetical protein